MVERASGEVVHVPQLHSDHVQDDERLSGEGRHDENQPLLDDVWKYAMYS